VTDWVAGALYRVDVSAKADLWLKLTQGTADIGYVPGAPQAAMISLSPVT